LLLAASLIGPLYAQKNPVPPDDKNPSHIPVPFRGPLNGRFEDFLKGRVEDAKEHADARQLLADLLKNLDKRFSAEEREQLKKAGILDKSGQPPKIDDPKTRELLECWLEQQRQKHDLRTEGDGQSGSIVPDKRTMEFLEKLLKEAPQGGGFTPLNPLRSPVGDAQRQSPSGGRPQGDVSAGAVPPLPPPEVPPPSTPKQEEFREGLSKLVEKMRESSLGNSPTLRRIGRELNRPLVSRSDGESEGFLGKLPRLGDYVSFRRLFTPDSLPSLGKPNWNGPRMPAVSAPGAAGMQSPSEGTVIGLAWIAVALIVVLLLWKLLAGTRMPPTSVQPAGWQLGRWPVNPAEVATRQDLIRAFEYLSLLLLGPAARAWNHLDIAQKLGESEEAPATQRRNAASHLAALYEQARYAPPEEPLPEDHLSDARRNLCLLAGVAAA
jgi:hypothetical protein